MKSVDKIITHYVNRPLIHEDRWSDLKAALLAAELERITKVTKNQPITYKRLVDEAKEFYGVEDKITAKED